MKRKGSLKLWSIAALFMIASPMQAIDIVVDMANGSWITAEVKESAKTGIYLKVDGSTVTTQSDAEGATFHFQANKWNDSQHGWVNSIITITVECPVKIGLGNCHYSPNQNGNLNDGTTNTVFTMADNCYHEDKTNNITYVYYKEEGTKTLTISFSNGYLPFFSIKTIDPSEIPGERTLTFDKGEGAGTAPAERSIDAGSTITLPKNRTLFVDGKTLTGWSDGVNTYAPNSSYTMPNANTTLTAVYTANTVSLSDRTEAVTITYDLAGNSENNSYSVDKDATGFMVTQASVNGTSIDVKADVVAKSLDFKSNGSGWHYIGKDTEVTVPSGLGATVSVFQYNTSGMTLDGADFNIPGTNQNATCTATSSATTAVIKQGNNDYWRTLTITLSAPQTTDVAVSSALYATYYNGTMALTLPEGLEAATVDNETSGTLTFNWRYKNGDVVPAGTPVLLKATTAKSYTLTEKIGDATPAPTGNLLHGSDVATTTDGGGTGAKYYALMNGANGLGFYWKAANGAAFEIAAHKAWLVLPAGSLAPSFSIDGEATGISEKVSMNGEPFTTAPVYNLNGQRVAQPTKGFYIVNGKKYIVK